MVARFFIGINRRDSGPPQETRLPIVSVAWALEIALDVSTVLCLHGTTQGSKIFSQVGA